MDICPLTGIETQIWHISSPSSFRYETPITGQVWLSDVAFSSIGSLTIEQKYILIGICRNRTLEKREPEILTTAFLNELYKQDIPYAFEERARHLLKYFYDNGGKEYVSQNLNSVRDCPISYSSPDEFNRIVKYVKGKNWLDYDSLTPTQTSNFYQGMMITESGIAELEGGKVKMPLFSMVDQRILTGNPASDAIIEHAKTLYFGEHCNFEGKKSACERLAFVLEPLRTELESMFHADTEDFFRIVNTFDIRHNKPSTKRIEHEEQLEWIFYSLLNTINTYVKMKQKLK